MFLNNNLIVYFGCTIENYKETRILRLFDSVEKYPDKNESLRLERDVSRT